MPEENPTDLQPGDKIEVLECYDPDGGRLPEWEGLGVVERANEIGVNYWIGNELAAVADTYGDRWIRGKAR